MSAPTPSTGTPRRPSHGGASAGSAKRPRPHSSGGNRHGGRPAPGDAQPAKKAYNPNLARFKRHNPGSGPHGFGGTYKKGEKGGLRASQELEQVPLAERGLHRTSLGAPAAVAAAHKPKAPSVAQLNSTTAIKSKIRDLTRLLKKPDLDPIVRQHKERELKQMEKALVEKQAENAREKIDARYKTVKFYERRKITRKLAGLQRRLATLFTRLGGDAMSAEEKAIRKEIAKWQLDADYIDYYPKGEKYIALYAGKHNQPSGDQADGEHKDNDDDDDDDESADEKADAKPMDAAKAAAAKEVEIARAAMRVRVAAAKAAALRAERAAASAATAPTKRKREETTDALFQEDDEDSDGNDDENDNVDVEDDDSESAPSATQFNSSTPAPAQTATKPQSKSKAPKPQANANVEAEEEEDELMKAADDDDDDDDDDDEATPAPKANAKASKRADSEQPKPKKQKHK